MKDKERERLASEGKFNSKWVEMSKKVPNLRGMKNRSQAKLTTGYEKIKGTKKTLEVPKEVESHLEETKAIPDIDRSSDQSDATLQTHNSR